MMTRQSSSLTKNEYIMSFYVYIGVTVLDRFRSNDDLRYCSRRGRVIYSPSPTIGGLPHLSAVRCVAVAIALDLGHKTICILSTGLGDLPPPSIRSTLYFSGTRASVRLDSVVSWPDPRVVLRSMIICLLKASYICCNPTLSDADCKRRSFELHMPELIASS